MAWKKYFGAVPTLNMPTWMYNSIYALAGAALYADSISKFVGIVLLMESILVSIERCWPSNERPN